MRLQYASSSHQLLSPRYVFRGNELFLMTVLQTREGFNKQNKITTRLQRWASKPHLYLRLKDFSCNRQGDICFSFVEVQGAVKNNKQPSPSLFYVLMLYVNCMSLSVLYVLNVISVLYALYILQSSLYYYILHVLQSLLYCMSLSVLYLLHVLLSFLYCMPYMYYCQFHSVCLTWNPNPWKSSHPLFHLLKAETST